LLKINAALLEENKKLQEAAAGGGSVGSGSHVSGTRSYSTLAAVHRPKPSIALTTAAQLLKLCRRR